MAAPPQMIEATAATEVIPANGLLRQTFDILLAAT
jgi:hypothetical protein